MCQKMASEKKFLLIYIWYQSSSINGKMLVFIILHSPHLRVRGRMDFNPFKRAQEDPRVSEVKAGGGYSNCQGSNSGSPTSAKGFQTQ